MIMINIQRFGGRGATSYGGGRYSIATEQEHEFLISKSKEQWGDDIQNQKGYVRTGLSFDVNKALRQLEDGYDITKVDLGTKEDWFSGRDWDFNKIVQNMDQLTSKPIVGGKNRLLTRFVDENWAYNALGVKSVSDLVNLDFKGTTFKEKAFMSTSTNPGANVFTGRPIKMEIEASPKTRGFVADNRHESEVVLPRNSQFKITRTYQDSHGNYVVRMKVINTPNNARGFAGDPMK